MGTRSTISVEHADGTVSSVYCHFDGYHDGVGKELRDNHNSLIQAEALVALGDLSTVCSEVVSYHRDRGEDWDDVKPAVFTSKDDLLEAITYEEYGQEYDYLFSDGSWYAVKQSDYNACGGRTVEGWVKVTDFLE